MKENLKRITNRRVFKYARFEKLRLLGCPICGPHKGCNRNWSTSRSWKDQTKKRRQGL